MELFRKTLGGLKASYYIRHFIFGAIISTFFIYISMQNPSGMKVGNVIFFVINALLYPYARFVYGYVNGLKTLRFRLLNYMEERISTKLSCVVQDTD